MEIILAKSAGFCSGVRRAVDLTLQASTAREGKITTYGPLVHNPQVIELLSFREVTCAEDLDQLTEGLAVIRSHGVPPADIEAIEQKGLRILDATCPKVGRVQQAVRQFVLDGRHVLIVGEPEHPEVKGLKGYGGDHCTVISTVEDLDALPKYEKVALLAQTTQNLEGFEKIRDRLAQMYPEILVKNTICAATRKRQDELRELAPKVDAVIVIGGKDSGNTKRLVRIAKDECARPTFWIETDEDLYDVDLSPYERVGVTAGASTPSWIIDRVMSYLHLADRRRRRPVLSKLQAALQFLIITSIYTSIGAGCLCYLGSVFLRIEFRPSFFALVFCYVLAMHVLNRFTETGVNRFRDDPLRQQFYRRHLKGMLALGVGAMAMAIILSIRMGVVTFLVILAASIVGVLYSVKVVPKRVFSLVGFRRLKDIAASKNFFVASAWAVVSIFPLFFIEQQHYYLRTASAFVFLFLSTGIRSIVMDLSDIAGDRLVGRDSVPIVLGEKRTWDMIRLLVVLLFIFCYVMSFLNVFPRIGYWIAIWILAEFLLIEFLFPKNYKYKSLISRDLLVDGHFIAAGLVAWIWNLLH